MHCRECKTDEIVTGCLYCLRPKIAYMQEEIKYYKRELELIHEEGERK